MEITDDERKRVLVSAINVLNIRGWTQGTYTNAVGEVCLLGALNQVCYGDADGTTEDRHPADHLKYETLKFVESLIYKTASWATSAVTWNDRAGRTKEEVVALLEKAAGLSI